MDGKEFDETLKYSGIGEKPNNFNASYFLFKEKNAIDSETYKKMDNQEYFDYELKTNASLMKLLNESEIENEQFLESQANKFRFQMLNNLITKLGEDYFAGKIVLVGTSAAGLLDIRNTALEKDITGVTIIAQGIC